MATHDAGPATLEDYGVDSSAQGGDHAPVLDASEGVVRCASCGSAVPFAATGEGPIRRAVARLASVGCRRSALPDVPVGDHVPTVTPAHPTHGRRVVCASCGREAPLYGDGEAVLQDLAAIPCIDRLSYGELLRSLLSPTGFSPTLTDLGVDDWYARPGDYHGESVVRVLRHERFQHTVYVETNDDGTYVAALRDAPHAGREPFATLPIPSDDPDEPATREAAVTLVTYLSATDPLSAGEFESLRSTYQGDRTRHREAWLADAYEWGRETFRESVGGSPEAFADAFAASVADAEEAIRRVVGSGGFDDLSESEFARETLGHDLEFQGFVGYVADRHGWSPPVIEP